LRFNIINEVHKISPFLQKDIRIKEVIVLQNTSKTPQYWTMTKKFSLKEIALQSGLSLASIDRVLHDRPNVSASAKRRVELAIGELERQHEAALITGRRFVIDVIMQAPKRFTTEIKNAFEVELPAMRPASFGARFHIAEHLSEEDVTSLTKAIKRRGSRGVVMKLPNSELTNKLASELLRERIPVVTYVTDIQHHNRTDYIGMDNNQAGAVAAYLVGKMLPKRDSKILLTLSSNLFDGEEQRAAGFKRVITDRFPHLGMVTVSEGQGLEHSTYQLVEKALADHADIEAVYSMGGANRSILSAFRDNARECKVYAAHDLDKENQELLSQGEIDFVIYHDFRNDARDLCHSLLHYHGMAPRHKATPSQIQIATPMS
jgi:LacI family transcriptional regulator